MTFTVQILSIVASETEYITPLIFVLIVSLGFSFVSSISEFIDNLINSKLDFITGFVQILFRMIC